MANDEIFITNFTLPREDGKYCGTPTQHVLSGYITIDADPSPRSIPIMEVHLIVHDGAWDYSCVCFFDPEQRCLKSSHDSLNNTFRLGRVMAKLTDIHINQIIELIESRLKSALS